MKPEEMTDEQLQEEFNRQSLNYHWILNQARNTYEEEVAPLEAELRKRKSQRTNPS